MLAPQPDCFTNLLQDFLICTTVHKSRHLGIFQGAVYVRITLDKMTRRTKSFENSENPYFNEYFVFEMKCTLMELLRSTILYEVKKHTACKKDLILGEVLIDMQSVWEQPNRCYFKKWGRLEAPVGQVATFESGKASGGFLQIDLAIVSQASNPNTLLKPYEEDLMALNMWHINRDYDDIEKNLLQNIDTGIRCNIRYTITFYRGIMSKKSDYLIQFRFHPFKGKTDIVTNTQNPSWNQEISFVWCYPSVAQTFVIQLLMHEHLKWKCVAEYELHFNEIAFNDKPSLGPTFINFYDNVNGSHYIGRLLVAIKSECLETESNHVMTLKHVSPLAEQRYWHEESFLIEFLALQGDFIHCSASSCKISVRLAEHNSNSIECTLKNYPTSLKKKQQPIKIFKYFTQPSPFKSITLRVQLPDNRSKFESDVALQEIIDFIKSEIELFKVFQIQYSGQYKLQLKVLRAILQSVIRKMEYALETKRLDYISFKEATQWDLNRLVYLKDYFQKVHGHFKSKHSNLKNSPESYGRLLIDEGEADLIKYCNEFQHLLSISMVQDAWPDLILVLLVGNKEIGFCRLNAKNFLYPSNDRETSNSSQCWKIKNLSFKDIKCQHTCMNCGCTIALIRGFLSIVTETQNSEFLSRVVQQWKHPEPLHWEPHIRYANFKCRLFIHQAKIRPGADRNGLCDPYVRVMISECAAETSIIFTSLSPIWNTVISFHKIQLPGSLLWYLGNPPFASIELYDTDKKTAGDYLGCGVLPLSVIKKDWEDWYARENAGGESDAVKSKHAIQKYELLKYLTPPPLKWIPIALKGVIKAEVLASGELVELEGGVEDENEYESENKNELLKATITVGIPNAIKPNMKNFVLEVVFAGFRNYRKRNFLRRKHRVKLMMADLILTSGLTTSPIESSINFLILYASGVVSLPEQLEYWPAIIATDVAISCKSKETTLGATLIANSKIYLQKKKVIPCGSAKYDIEVESASTTIQRSESENESSEVKPLIHPKSDESYMHGVLKKLKFLNMDIKPSEQIVSQMQDESEYNWWTKFYNSGFIAPCGALSTFKHKLCIYQNELEKQLEFSYFTDWADALSMVHGVRYRKNVLPREEIYATLKLNIKITPCICPHPSACGGDGETLKPLATALNPRYQAQLQSLAELVKITVRVYIVQAMQLRPSEERVQADSYVKVQLGKKLIANRADYIPHQSNPVFGKCFELEGMLPREHILEVTVFNRKDVRDESIGSTFIDLEDRWRTKHRSTVGIANEYCSFGYNKWHDLMPPSEILEDLCKSNDLKAPKLKGNMLEVDGILFEDETEIATSEDLLERLSLTVLRNFQHLPSFGYRLVPQHVETRSLYRNECPGIEQGKIQLWIELFDGNLNIPPPIDITPQPPENYELRVIIYNVSEVILNEKNIFGTSMSDIYIKGWCSSFEDAQQTDVHYRSLNGEGNFNWRMLFPLKYSKIEDMLVVKRRTILKEEYELKQPPILNLQIWNNNFVAADDFLGSLEINLSGFPEPFENAKQCDLLDVTQSITSYGSTTTKKAKINVQRTSINLFKKKKVRGWLPMIGNVKDSNKFGEIGLAGKVELELEVFTESYATSHPVGLGRDGPHNLEEPKRPKTSFNPVTNPKKTAKYTLLPQFWKHLFALVIIFLLCWAFLPIIAKIPTLVIKRRIGILEESEFKQPPMLYLQIWDNDFVSADDFLGSLEINISGLQEPFENAKKCVLLDATPSITSYGSTISKVAKTKSKSKLINLFKEKKVRGWFPIRGNLNDSKKSGEIGLAGKIDLELEVLTEVEAALDPAGLGRKGPHKLDEPNRPKTSFNPFMNPIKGLKHIVLPQVIKYLFIIVLVIIVGYKLLQLLSKFPFFGFLG